MGKAVTIRLSFEPQAAEASPSDPLMLEDIRIVALYPVMEHELLLFL